MIHIVSLGFEFIYKAGFFPLVDLVPKVSLAAFKFVLDSEQAVVAPTANGDSCNARVNLKYYFIDFYVFFAQLTLTTVSLTQFPA